MLLRFSGLRRLRLGLGSWQSSYLPVDGANSVRYRIEPNKTQVIALSEMLSDFCELYNCALEHRIAAYRKGVSICCNDQIKALPVIRRDLPHQGRWSSTAQQQVLRKLDKSFKAFFQRIRSGEKAGFPRFRASARYHAADFRISDGMRLLKSGKLAFLGIPGEIKVRWHRSLPSKPRSAIISRSGSKWHIIFHVEVACENRAGSKSIALDMGLTTLAALSNGDLIARNAVTARHARALRVKQRALARCKRGSARRRKAREAVTKLHTRIGNQRRDYLHKVSAVLVARYGAIAIEKLNVKGLASGFLAKSVNDASWGQLISMLRYKAEKAGVMLIEVDPRGTSQTCPQCGAVAKKTLAIRMHRCDCGCTLDRDVAAAKVIHSKAFGLPPEVGGGSLSQRVSA